MKKLSETDSMISFHAWSLKLMVEGDICSNKYVNNYD